MRRNINTLVAKLIYLMERINLEGYVEYLQSPFKIFWVSFLSGVAKGLGSVIGFTVLGSIIIYSLVEFEILNLPELINYLNRL